MVDTSFKLNCFKPLAPWITCSYTVFLYKYKFAMKQGAPSLHSTRLLDQVRERVLYKHFSLKTENDYLYWIRFFIRWSATQSGGMRHPRELGVTDVEAFLSMLANERKVSASTHNQALSALLFCTGRCWVLICLGLTTLGDRSRPSAFLRC